jgi:cytochrome c6
MHWKLKTAIATVALTLIGWTAQAADASANWEKHCAKCHGKEGKGDTKMGQKLKVKDYSDAKVQEKMTDEHMVKITKEGAKEGGKTVMKAYSPELSDAEITDLVAFIRKMKK